MENKKEPLMSAEEFLIKKINHVHQTVAMQKYANYVTQWHLKNAKEFVWNDFDVDKQSIHTAIDNYIKDNL